MTPDEQITLWVAGDSRCPNDRDECCPDFSCCKPALLMPLEERQRFQRASQSEREMMLMGALVSLVGDEIMVTGVALPAPCDECGKTAELRPYGTPDKPNVCFGCFNQATETLANYSS